jgi:predicted nucleotidyltransferase
MSSGRFVLRLPPALHAQLRGRARERGVSLNAYCVALLEAGPAGTLSAPIRECVEGFGEAVDGVVLFGSVARGSATDASDADLLIVLRPGTAVTRDLYTRWDELDSSRAELEGHPVNPHFSVRPAVGATVGGLWYEVARDGIVLWERGTVVRATLARLRRQILDGEVEERRRGGQSYWMHRRDDHA